MGNVYPSFDLIGLDSFTERKLCFGGKRIFNVYGASCCACRQRGKCFYSTNLIGPLECNRQRGPPKKTNTDPERFKRLF